ncbi:MAG: Hsp20/alpha crystallin family protein [Chloroflexota bacterium]
MMSNLMRLNPARDMLTLRDAMNQLFNESFVPSRENGNWAFPLDLYETEGNYTARLVTPGLAAEQLEINWENNVLFVKGQIEYLQLEGRPLVQEQRSGTFSRAIQFPASVNTEGIEANLKDGILTIVVPKSETARTKRISINTVS